MNTNESELTNAFRNAEKRLQIARENHRKFLAKIQYADESHTVPESDNEEWTKVTTELEEAEAEYADTAAAALDYGSGNP